MSIVGLLAVALLAAGMAGAQGEPSIDAVPPMDGASLEGTILEEGDVVIDDLGNTRLDLRPSAKEAEPLPPDLEDRLDALSDLRAAMAEGVAQEAAPLLVPPLDDPDAPPRMDARVRDPDRLGRAEASAAADEAAAAYEPEIPVDVPADAAAAAR